jgi:hypothetical protein
MALMTGVLVALGAGGIASSSTVPDRAPAPQLAPGLLAEPGGRERVGTVERVDAVLGYLDADRSATFRYPGAEYVKVHLSRSVLLPGDY